MFKRTCTGGGVKEKKPARSRLTGQKKVAASVAKLVEAKSSAFCDIMLFLAASDSDAAPGVIGLILILAALMFSAVIYFVPTFIAAVRGHSNTLAIVVLNLFTGWTFIGWIVSSVWALTTQQKPQTIVVTQPIQNGTIPTALRQIRDIETQPSAPVQK
jgi:Superinfection immunity protein